MAYLRWFLAWVLLSMPVMAQQANPSVLVIDSERLFFETEYGQRLSADIAAKAADLQAENDQIVATLTQEEQSLTARRPTMSPEEFAAEAEAFDTKVQEVRRVRDAKNVELQVATAGARAEFEEQVQNIIASIMFDRGASMILEQRNVVLSVRAINITEDAIARIDAELGDGLPQ